MSAEERGGSGGGGGGTYEFDCFHTELVNCAFFPRRRRLNRACKCHSGIFTLQIRPPPLGSDPPSIDKDRNRPLAGDPLVSPRQ